MPSADGGSRGSDTKALPDHQQFFTSEEDSGGIGTRERTMMRLRLRSALVGSAAAIAVLAVPGAALAAQGNDAIIEPSPAATVAMNDVPPGMHMMMNSPGHERFVASSGHEHVMSSPGHQAMMMD